ncbi:segregation and condensation protein B [Bradyrhizobium sp. USDA 4341]
MDHIEFQIIDPEAAGFDPDDMLTGEVEALVFASPRPLSENEVARHAEIDVEQAAAILKNIATRTRSRAVQLAKGLDGWAFSIAADAPVPDVFHREVSRKRAPTEAELATVAVIAMREPATVPEIEAARGVDLSRGVIEALVNRGWIRPAVRRTDAGRAVAYETTQDFLIAFGVQSAADIPTLEEAMHLGLDA